MVFRSLSIKYFLLYYDKFTHIYWLYIEFHRCWLLTLFSYSVYLIICILCPFIYPNQYPHEGMSAANFPMLYNWFTPKLNRHKMLYNLAHVIVADIRSNVLRRVIM